MGIVATVVFAAFDPCRLNVTLPGPEIFLQVYFRFASPPSSMAVTLSVVVPPARSCEGAATGAETIGAAFR